MRDPFDPVLRRFLIWLIDRHQMPGDQEPRGRRRKGAGGEARSLSQVEIARQSRVSQSVVQKYVNGMIQRVNPEIQRKVLTRYATDWAEYLGTHPDVSAELQEDYAWLVPAMSTASARARAPELAHAVRSLDAIFELAEHVEPTHRQVVLQLALQPILQQIRSQLDIVRKFASRDEAVSLMEDPPAEALVQGGSRRPVQSSTGPLPGALDRARKKT